MNQPLPNSPQEAWLQVRGKDLVAFPEGWWDELGVQNGTFVKAKKEGKKVIIETQAVEVVPARDAEEKTALLTARLKNETQQLEQLYRLRNPEEVWHFLETHQYLLSYLVEAHDHIRKYFPTDVLFLEYTADPEIVGEEQLIVSIAAEQDVDEAHDALNQLDHDWWFEANSQADDDLCIMLRFV
ncbi:MAG TPA: hypothetical protein VN207_06595 [Ktedonobacteraceae bacterium]|nr:hypothetical protein [Ktedonobacteraceae bacterium]